MSDVDEEEDDKKDAKPKVGILAIAVSTCSFIRC